MDSAAHDPDAYLTLAASATGTYREKGSRFLAFAYPAADEDAVRHHLSDLRRTYHDARHHCYAYIFEAGGPHFRTADDGEPHHSAGDPILGQIRARGLSYALVVVVRYFGGVKLGVGGLIQAYRTAAAEALKAAPTTIAHRTRLLQVGFSYEQTSPITRLLDGLGLHPSQTRYDTRCHWTVPVRLAQARAVESQLLETGATCHWLT